MDTYKVVPDVLAVAPSEILNVVYPDIEVNLGNEIKPRKVKDKPKVEWKSEPSSYYTLCMTDPDNAQPTDVLPEWHHWLVGNIPGNNVADGETLAEYIGSGPPDGTGLHRYVFVLYKQPGRLTFDEKRLGFSVDGRASFKIGNFAQKYNLGNPVAANFYLAQFDDWVPQLYELLGA
ncbi:protein D2-like [Bradysia coprophila]|uniref:protein D2-like n=1 Tax=Bradysia coprophila TaxID=38358 RepID=UPI00187D9416|nr:protein D2-like [Bradysia coprophila]